jgi:hypothetical protein
MSIKTQNRVAANSIAINKSLSDLLKVEPLQAGEKAVYRLVNAGKLDSKKRPQFVAGHYLTGSTSIYDPGDSGNKTIENITSYTRVQTEDGRSFQKPRIERIKFGKKNEITLTSAENNQYAYMERHPANRDNPYKPSGQKALFYRVQQAKTKKWLMDSDLLMLDAMSFVRDANTEELAPVAEAFKLEQGAVLQDWKADLLKAAKKDPEKILRASANAYLKHKVLLRDAIEFKFIFFDAKDRVWRWQITGEHVKRGDVLCKVEADQEAFERLIDHIQSDKKGFADKREIDQLLSLGVGA